MKTTTLILGIAICLAHGLTASHRPPIILSVPGLDSNAAPASMAFGTDGQLFVAYRNREPSKESHGISICVFDGSSGRLGQIAKVQATVRQLPIGAGMLQISPDGRLLLYAETPQILTRGDGGYIAVLDANTLKVIDSLDLAKSMAMGLPNLRVFGFSVDSRSVLVSSSLRDDNNLLTKSVRVIALNAQDLRQTIKDVSHADPYETLFYTVDPAGLLLFVKNTSTGRVLVGSDGTRRADRPEVIVNSEYGLGHLIFLGDATLAITNGASKGRPTSEIYRFEKGQSEPIKAQSEADCWFRSAKISPDESIGVAACEATHGAEMSFGTVTIRRVVIFNPRSLRVLATLPISKRPGAFDLAVWHGAGEVRLAAPSNSGRIAIQTVDANATNHVR